MPAIHAQDAKQYEFGEIKFLRLAAPQTGARETSLWKFRLPPNSEGAVHQITREEIMVIMRGAARAEIGKESHALAEGDAIIVPAHTDFRLSATGDEPVEGVALAPVGAQAVMPGQAPFIPPWTT
jgi:quercetin dioxygenase-like cupin family protein